MAQHLEIIVEELSMESALRAIVPKMIGHATFEVYPHQCKSDLLKNLPNRMRGYAKWLPADWRIIVIVDRDNDDCGQLKNKLERVAATAGMKTRAAGGNAIHVVSSYPPEFKILSAPDAEPAEGYSICPGAFALELGHTRPVSPAPARFVRRVPLSDWPTPGCSTRRCARGLPLARTTLCR